MRIARAALKTPHQNTILTLTKPENRVRPGVDILETRAGDQRAEAAGDHDVVAQQRTVLHAEPVSSPIA